MRSVIKILSNRNHSQEKMIELYQTGLNNTASTDQSYIIFTKNAKTGSETVKSVISKLFKKNNFTMVTENFKYPLSMSGCISIFLSVALLR